MIALAILGLLVFAILSVFQLLLIFGRPLGDYAWGGKNRILSKNLRIASAFTIILYFMFSLFLASKAGVVSVIPNSQILDTGMWILTAYFFLGVIMNAISRNIKERIVMTPTALLLAIIFLSISI